jgi:hypothetical protein
MPVKFLFLTAIFLLLTQLGTGDRRDQLTPVSVLLPSGVRVLSASAGEQFSAIVATDSDTDGIVPEQQYLYTWGGNIYGTKF